MQSILKLNVQNKTSIKIQHKNDHVFSNLYIKKFKKN